MNKLTHLDVSEHRDRAEKLLPIIQSLPVINRVTLKELLKLCAKIVLKSDVNKMTASNLAIVLAPNLLYRKEDAFSFSDMEKCNGVVETMIIHYNYLFENIPLAASDVSNTRSSISVDVSTPPLSPRSNSNVNSGWSRGVKPSLGASKRIGTIEKQPSNENISESKNEMSSTNDPNNGTT